MCKQSYERDTTIKTDKQNYSHPHGYITEHLVSVIKNPP
jgi:hypothetical protein